VPSAGRLSLMEYAEEISKEVLTFRTEDCIEFMLSLRRNHQVREQVSS
jgi:hypothetical protein